MLDVVTDVLTVAVVAGTIVTAFALGAFGCAYSMAKDAPQAYHAWMNARKARRRKHD